MLANPSLREMIDAAKQGNAYACAEMSNRFVRSTDPNEFDNTSFWTRMGDALTMPGWAAKQQLSGAIALKFEFPRAVKARAYSGTSRQVFSGARESMLVGARSFIREGDLRGMVWLQECARRGHDNCWRYLASAHSGLHKSPASYAAIYDPMAAYALADACVRIEPDRYSLRGLCYGIRDEVARRLQPEHLAIAKEASTQQAAREAILPEVIRQIDAWVEEVKRTEPVTYAEIIAGE